MIAAPAHGPVAARDHRFPQFRYGTSMGAAPVRHAFTVDVKDWHQGIPVADDLRVSAEWRLKDSVQRLLEMLSEAGVRATFFWLGPAAERHPDLVKDTLAAGHEIGTHGWSHELLYLMDRDRFREETRRAMGVVEDITGLPVRAYRAAYFSITDRSLWALDVLAELGFLHDSSIFPIRNWRYGIPGFDPSPHQVHTPGGAICELPISVRDVGGRRIPVSGGAYFRIYPYALTYRNFVEAERAARPVVFYLHPWELDPAHPRVRFQRRAHLTHYARLASTEPKLQRLLEDFSFGPLGEVLDTAIRRGGAA